MAATDHRTTDEGVSPPGDTGDKGLVSNPRVFVPSALILIGFTVLTLVLPDQVGSVLAKINGTVVGDLGWYYILLVTGFVFFSLWVALSPMGRIVLGPDDEPAEYGLLSWFAMLFAAGMGIGLVFWGVAEPLSHFASPPPGTPDNAAERAKTATDVTFLHWGLHAWAIYVVVGLAIAYAVHRRGRPVSIRWALEPALGDRVKGLLGDVIDIIAIIGTLFGVATSLGFGVLQVGAGLGFLGWVDTNEDGDVSKTLLVILIAIITAMAVTSVATGVDKGIKILSNLNMVVAALLLLAVLLMGPTIFLLSDFVGSVGSYLRNFFQLSFQTFANEGSDGKAWLSGWTTFYWGWWISWAPFVGVFIARISKGRTVREFVTGVLLVPTTVTFLWFSVLGGSALYRQMFGEGGMVGEDGVNQDTALFQLLEGLPASTLLTIVAMVLVTVFFVTSSDSGSFVVDMLASGGDPNPPMWSRIMWGVLEGAVAAALLLAGGDDGLSALRTMAILLALPFSLVMLAMVWSLSKELLREHGRMERAERRLLADEIAGQIARRHDVQLTPTPKEPSTEPPPGSGSG